MSGWTEKAAGGQLARETLADMLCNRNGSALPNSHITVNTACLSVYLFKLLINIRVFGRSIIPLDHA